MISESAMLPPGRLAEITSTDEQNIFELVRRIIGEGFSGYIQIISRERDKGFLIFERGKLVGSLFVTSTGKQISGDLAVDFVVNLRGRIFVKSLGDEDLAKLREEEKQLFLTREPEFLKELMRERSETKEEVAGERIAEEMSGEEILRKLEEMDIEDLTRLEEAIRAKREELRKKILEKYRIRVPDESTIDSLLESVLEAKKEREKQEGAS